MADGGTTYAMQTLQDYLRPGLDIVSIGLNPSLYSVKKGFYFARPQNRFWKALNASKLADQELVPGKTAMNKLFREHGIGFTDVVKRPTANAAGLESADFRKWVPVLRDKLLHYRPRIAWFHGKLAYKNFLRYSTGADFDMPWGAQIMQIGESAVFVSPNPSPANAAFSHDELVGWYVKLKKLREILCE